MSAGVKSAVTSKEKRIALVIGIGSYQFADRLINPSNDARAMAGSLARLGFKVELQIDVDQYQLRQAVREFGLAASRADVALVYYAGHSIQVDNENYLLPVDTRLERELDLLYEGLPVDIVMSEVAQAKLLGLVILDACRNNPLANKLARSLGIHANRVGRGLARLNDVPSDTLIAFATRANAVAVDGTGRNSPYTAALLEHLQTPGLELSLFFRKIRDSVLTATSGFQEPFTYGSLGGQPFYLYPAPPNRRPTVGTPTPLVVADDATATVFEIVGPSDPDEDVLSVEVTEVPRKGRVLVGDRLVNQADVLTAEELQAAAYIPKLGEIGDLGAFAFRVTDPRGGIASGNIPVTVFQSNRAPEAWSSLSLAIGRVPLGMIEPTDPDGDPLTVTVTKAPSEGAVLLGPRPLILGDVIEPADVPSLVFHPGSSFSGDAGVFEIKIEDSHGATSRASVRIALPGYASKAPSTAEANLVQEQPEAPPEKVETPTKMPSPEQLAETPTKAPSPEQLAETPAKAMVQIEALTGVYRLLADSKLREEPSHGAKRMALLERGGQVKVTGRVSRSNWFRVATESGTQGFLFGDSIEPVKSETSRPQVAVAVPAEESKAKLDTRLNIDELKDGKAFKDCDACPTMMRIAPGVFEMGDSSGHVSARPAHRVTIARAFAIGRYEVTVAEWRACADDGGCDPRSALEDGPSTLPVIDVSWHDTQAYVSWLNGKTGKRYRLPSEAEWEYVARAGSRSRFWWGNEIGESNANCKGCGGNWNRKRPAVAGSYAPNRFGVYDMNGGAAEWVADCWNKSYAKAAPVDGSAWTRGDCSRRVLRGGSWRNDPSYLSSSERLYYDIDVRYVANGFRVVRELD